MTLLLKYYRIYLALIKHSWRNWQTRKTKDLVGNSMQVHDELILEAPESEAELASEILKYEMENAVKLKVPLEVEVHGGKNWYDAK